MNDLHGKDAKKIIENIAEMFKNVTEESPTTKGDIAELIHRADKPEYGKKIR